jgi:hypothetical protein
LVAVGLEFVLSVFEQSGCDGSNRRRTGLRSDQFHQPDRIGERWRGCPSYLPTLLWNAVIAQVMYASLLVAIVYIKLNAMDATTLAQTMSLKAHTDTLTGILNRRGLDSRLEKVANNIQFD